ncbi:hypothetical protein FH603_5895, partial [Spirosoma sp. LMG 31447]|nr:hypothetical protein [Spirosoma utsteinense]
EVKGPVGSRAAAVEVVGLVLVGPGGVGLPAQAELALGGGGTEPHAGGWLGDVEPGELAGGGIGVVELEPIAVGRVSRVAAAVDVEGVGGGGDQAGVDGGHGGPVGAVQSGGALEPVLVGTAQVAGLQTDGAAPADGDASVGVTRGVDGDLGEDGGQAGQFEAGLGGGNAESAVDAAASVGVLGHQAVGVAHAPAQGAGVGEGDHAGRHPADLLVAQAGGQARLAVGGGVVGAALLAVDDKLGGVQSVTGGAGVGVPAELDGPAVGGGRGAGGQVLDGGPDDADAQGLEGDQRGDAAGGHVVDLQGDVVGGLTELLAGGLPDEAGRGGLGQGAGGGAGVAELGVGGRDEFARWQGPSVGAHVEDAPEGRQVDAVAVGVGGGDGLVDEGAGHHAQVGQGLDEGSFVGLVDDDDLHVAGDLPDEHPVAPLLDDEGEVVLAFLAGGIPAEFTGAGVDGEGGGSAGLGSSAEPGGVEVGGDVTPPASGGAGDVLGDAEPEGERVTVGVEGGRVVAESLADASRVEGWVEEPWGGVESQGGVDEDGRGDEELD